MGWALPPLYKKDAKYFDNKIAQYDAKIAKLEEEKAVYVAEKAKISGTKA